MLNDFLSLSLNYQFFTASENGKVDIQKVFNYHVNKDFREIIQRARTNISSMSYGVLFCTIHINFLNSTVGKFKLLFGMSL